MSLYTKYFLYTVSTQQNYITIYLEYECLEAIGADSVLQSVLSEYQHWLAAHVSSLDSKL